MVAAALMTPLTTKDRISRFAAGGVLMARVAGQLIKPNSSLTSLERLEIYSRSYWFRLLDSFRDDFPGLAKIMGPVRFERLARAYLAACPSQCFTLRNLGSQLEAWLQQHPKLGGNELELALDMIRLEWAHIEAFDGLAVKALDPEDLAEFKPSLRVGLQPYISLLALLYPVDEIRVQCGAESEVSKATSNAATRKLRRSDPQVGPPLGGQIFLAVHRLDLSVYYRRLSIEEFHLLNALLGGHSIASAIGISFRNSAVPPDDIPKMLEVWFTAWAEFGWLTIRRVAKGGTHS